MLKYILWPMMLAVTFVDGALPSIASQSHSDEDSCYEASGQKLLWRGIDAMYSYRFDEAEAALDSMMNLCPDVAVTPFVAVANQWLKALTERGYQASHVALRQAIKDAVPLYDAMLQNPEIHAEAELFLGSTYGLHSRVALGNRRWATVIYDGVRGWRLVRRALAADSSLADAYLAIGIFDYYASMSSVPVQLVARMFGINPDKATGLQEIDRAVRGGRYAWIEAASTLAIAYVYIENRPDLALPYAEMLLQRYPQNYYFNFLYAEILLGLRRTAELRDFMVVMQERLKHAHPGQQHEWAIKYASLEAHMAFLGGDFDTVLEKCNWIIENYTIEFDWHLGFALMLRGQVREAAGDMLGARQDYRQVVNLNNRTYAVDEARQALMTLQAKWVGRQ